MQPQVVSAKARIERIVKFFTRDDVPDLAHFVSGVNTPTAHDIDDGQYGDPDQSRRKPDFIEKELHGWE